MRVIDLFFLLCDSIAKKEEKIYVPHLKEPIVLSYSSEVLKLLQRVRDESHRFAITTHRSKRTKRLSRTVLLDIPGVGKHLAAALLSRFGSVSALANLSPEDLSVVKGVGPVLADKIIKFIQEGDDPSNETHS
jgi:excinuclease ABC subunit C